MAIDGATAPVLETDLQTGLLGNPIRSPPSRQGRWETNGLRLPFPPANRVVKTMPLSVRVDAGMPCVPYALRNSAKTMGPVTRRWAVAESA
jgi:hypothetical protein